MLEKSLDILSTEALAETPITAEIIKTDDFVKKYEDLATVVKYLSDVKKEVDNKIKELVKEHYVETGDNSVGSDNYRFTYVPISTRETLDTKLLKQEDPETYKKYVKISKVADSLRTYKLNKNDEESAE